VPTLQANRSDPEGTMAEVAGTTRNEKVALLGSFLVHPTGLELYIVCDDVQSSHFCSLPWDLSTPRFLLLGKSRNISTAASGSINMVNQRQHTQQRQECGDRVYQPVHPKRAQSDAAQREKGKQCGQGMEGQF
jgi:hypothetical protein